MVWARRAAQPRAARPQPAAAAALSVALVAAAAPAGLVSVGTRLARLVEAEGRNTCSREIIVEEKYL